MNKTIYTLLVLLISLSTAAQVNPQTKNITHKFFPAISSIENTTPALKKEKGFTNYIELWNFLTDLVKQYPNKIQLSYIGESQNGKRIPMVFLTNRSEKEKIKVWMQGGLHGDEMASTEGMLYLIDQLLANNSNKNILDNIELAIVPMVNIDGYLKQNRGAANGLDLNRDQTKLMAKESILLKKAFADFNPAVVVDFHEYRPYRRDFAMMGDFGISSRYDVMFLYTGNLNVPENLRKITDKLFVENARKMHDKNAISHHPYISTGDYFGEVHFNQGSINARSSATNYALTNTISTLVEVRGVGIGNASFKRRIFITYTTAISFLKTAAMHQKEIKEAIENASQQTNDVVVLHNRAVYKDKVEVIDLNTEEIINLEVVKRDALKSSPILTRKRPIAYYVDANQQKLIAKLKILGVTVEELSEVEEIMAEKYIITAYNKNDEKYEKMNQQEVQTKVISEIKRFDKGTYKVSMNQKRANIVIELLEPEAPNSFVSFGVLETSKGAELPIYRILN